MPLHDRNGDRVAAVRLTMDKFPGMMDKTAYARALPVIRAMEAQLGSLAALILIPGLAPAVPVTPSEARSLAVDAEQVVVSLNNNLVDNYFHKGEFMNAVEVLDQSLPQPMTVDEYYQANLPMMKTILPNFTEVSTAPFTENVTWKKVVYTWQTATGRALKVTSYYFIKGMKAYIITATATPTTSAQYETKFDEIARSFRWNKN